MAWAKLENPKPSASSLAPGVVKVRARELKVRGGGTTRYVSIAVGSKLADQARFIAKEHRCHILLGSGADAGKAALQMDDQAGKFIAKRKAAGHYELTIKAGAAQTASISLEFPPFERGASVQRIDPAQAPVIMFDIAPDFVARS